MEVTDGAFSCPNRWALALGTGLALYGIHWAEQPLLDYLFLPQIGLMIIVFCLAFYYMKYPHKPDLGSKYIWIPMLIIVASIMAWVFIDFSMKAVASAFYGISLFAVYLVARQLGKSIFLAFIPFVVIVAISCIYNGIAHPGEITGGIITNYCASAGFMIFGTIVNRFKWQWVLATLVLIALFLTGAAEVLIILGAIGLTVLIRRDWTKRILIPAGIVILLVLTWTVFGITQDLYKVGRLGEVSGISNRFAGIEALVRTELLNKPSQIEGIETRDEILDYTLAGRWTHYRRAIEEFSFIGRGFNPSLQKPVGYGSYKEEDGYVYYEGGGTIHNVPLIIVDQVGLLAGLAWLFVGIFCLVKTKWKYAWVAILAMSVFDHYIWTQFAPYWWCLVGVSTASELKSDLIFKERMNDRN